MFTGTLRCVERRVSWFVLCRCQAADPEADGEVKAKEDILSSMNLPTGEEINMGELAQEYAQVGLDITHLLEECPVVDDWQRKFEHGRSLINPDKYKEMGTQMYELNQWYLDACKRDEEYILLKIRDEHWGRGDDIIFIYFQELHQLCHMNSLDKSLISSFCL